MEDKRNTTHEILAAEKPEPGPEKKPDQGEHKWEPEELPADTSVPVALTGDDVNDKSKAEFTG